MTDPCEKERIEYEKALNEELSSQKMVDIPLEPLSSKTPSPF